MSFRLRTVRDTDELRSALGGIAHYFGWQPTDEDVERFSSVMPLERMHAVFDGGEVVAGAGVLPFEMTLPAGPTPCAGVTVVGVLPTHRRRGLLRRMMETQLRDVRERGEPIAALWASEETIYGRFGYGLASMTLLLDIDRHATRIRPELPREGSTRLVDKEEALRAFPRVYERVRKRSVGFLSRSPAWWEHRRLADRPEQRRGAGPLNRALFTRDGKPAGYATYRIAQEGSTPEDWKKTVRVSEVVGVDDAAAREVWRFLLSIDWTDRVEAFDVAVDDPLLLNVDRVNKLNARMYDALWIRLVDVAAALAARGTESRVAIEVTSDSLFPDNVGTWVVEGGVARRSTRRPDVRTDVQGLGSAFLGGFSFAQLARSGRVEEGSRGGLARADAAFRVERAPFCPEVF